MLDTLNPTAIRLGAFSIEGKTHNMDDQLAEAVYRCTEYGGGEPFVVNLDGAERSRFGGWITTAWDLARPSRPAQ